MKHIIFSLLVVLGLASCNSSDARLKSMVKELQETCPQETLDGAAICDSIILDDNNELCVVYTLKTATTKVLPLESISQTGLKEQVVINLTKQKANDKNTRELLEELVKAQKTLTVRFRERGSQKSIETTLSTEELRKLLSDSYDAKELARKSLAIQMKQEAANYPMHTADGIDVERVTIEGDRVVYDITMREDIAAVSPVMQNPAAAKKELLENLVESGDKGVKVFIRQCIDAEYDIVYRYTTGKTHKQVELAYSPQELQKACQPQATTHLGASSQAR